MTPFSTKALVLFLVAVAVASEACTLASPTEVEMKPATQGADVNEAKDGKAGAAGGSSSSSSSSSPGGGCEAAKFTTDVSKLTACGNGKGHCAPKANMNQMMQTVFGPDTCKSGELCVDDNFIQAGGKELKECNSSLSGKGRCLVMELNVPMVKDGRAVALKSAKSECAADEICSPCVDPTNNNADTGFCHPMGISESACTGGSGGATTSGDATPAPSKPAPECCGGKGQCMVKSGLPNGSGDKMEQDTCAEANVCAPKALVASKATKCTTMFMSGICIGGCFNSMLEKATDFGLLRQGDCGEEESCVPCTVVKKFMAGDGTPVPGCE